MSGFFHELGSQQIGRRTGDEGAGRHVVSQQVLQHHVASDIISERPAKRAVHGRNHHEQGQEQCRLRGCGADERAEQNVQGNERPENAVQVIPPLNHHLEGDSFGEPGNDKRTGQDETGYVEDHHRFADIGKRWPHRQDAEDDGRHDNDERGQITWNRLGHPEHQGKEKDPGYRIEVTDILDPLGRLEHFDLPAPTQMEVQEEQYPQGHTNEFEALHPRTGSDLLEIADRIVFHIQRIEAPLDCSCICAACHCRPLSLSILSEHVVSPASPGLSPQQPALDGMPTLSLSMGILDAVTSLINQ